MVNIYQSYPTVRILELMILAVRRQIDIRSLGDGFFDEFGTGTATQGNGLYRFLRGSRVADVRAIQDIANLSDKIEIIDRFR